MAPIQLPTGGAARAVPRINEKPPAAEAADPTADQQSGQAKAAAQEKTEPATQLSTEDRLDRIEKVLDDAGIMR